jgi:AraC family transcriptional regulator
MIARELAPQSRSANPSDAAEGVSQESRFWRTPRPQRRRLREQSEKILNSALGEVEALDLTPEGVDFFEVAAVRGPVLERRIGVWPGLCLMRCDGPTRITHMRCEGQRFRGGLSDGQISVWATGALSDIEWASKSAYQMLIFSASAVEDALSQTPPGRRPQIRSRLQADDPMLEAICTGLMEEAERGWPKGPGYAAWFAQTILSRVVETCTEQEAEAIDGARGLSPRQLARALELIEQGIDSDICLPEIAEAVGLSRFHFARAFRRSIGVPPIKHLINRRLDRAGEMLRSGQASVLDAALTCGYDNTSNFTRAFRGRYGVTPSEFVRLHRG